jgi:hypothetical protein
VNMGICQVCNSNHIEYSICPVCHRAVCSQCMTTLLKSIGDQSRRKICYVCKEKLTGVLTQKNLLRLECSLTNTDIKKIIDNPNQFILCYDYGTEEGVELTDMFTSFRDLVHSLKDESLDDIQRNNLVIWDGKCCKIKFNAELFPE